MEVIDFKNELQSLVTNQDSSEEQIEKFIREFYFTKPLPIVKAGYEHFVRCGINNNGEVFKNVSRCSYNPNIDNIPLMRCNYPRQQVFYAAVPTLSENASASATAIMETAIEHIKNHNVQRHYMTLSRWQIRRKLDLFLFPFSAKSIKGNCDFATANENFQNVMHSTFGDAEQEAINYFRESLEYMSDIFCETENKYINYRISAAFFNCIMKFAENKKINIDGVMYPSANTLANGISVVLRKGLIDDGSLVCDYVQMYVLQRKPNNPMDISFFPVSDGAIPDANGNFRFAYIN